jgi:hypothetical protein
MMGDWSNDDLQVGDLVILHNAAVGYMRDMLEDKGMGVVVDLDTPPRGSLQTYNVKILTPKGIVNTYRQYIEKVQS